MVQSNRLMRPGPSYYPKAIGVKTGYYSLAGNTLVAAAVDGSRTLIAVLLKVPNRKTSFSEARKLFEAAFKQVKVERVLLHKGIQKFALKLPQAEKKIRSYLKEDVSIEYFPAEEPEVKCLLQWDKRLALPIAKDQQIGELSITFAEGQLIKKIPLYTLETQELPRFHKFKRLFKPQGGLLKTLAWLALAAGAAASILLLWRKKRTI